MNLNQSGSVQLIQGNIFMSIMSCNYDQMDVEKLILKVKEHSGLYNASDTRHSNRNYISSTWKTIANDLGCSKDAVKKKWHQLRSNYMREKRSSKSKPTSQWSYFDIMSFLEPFTELKHTADNIKQEQMSEYFRDKSKNRNDPILINQNVVTAEPTAPITVEKPQSILDVFNNKKDKLKKRKVVEIDEENVQHLEIKSSRIDEIDPEQNADKMFLLSLLTSMKQLTPADNMDFKIQVQQILKNKLFPNTIRKNCQCPASVEN